MENQPTISSSHAMFSLRLHVVLVTKYRRKVLNAEIRDHLRETFDGILDAWRCSMIEFGGEEDHVHLLIEIHPALDISQLVNNLKSASSRKVRNRYAEHVAKFYWKPYFWNRAYYVGTVGSVSLETIKRYVEMQGVTEKKSKPPA